MTNFIPIFPLGIVVYPGEQLNLHIFESRYKELINECYAEAKPFGIPTVLNNRVADMGTLVEIVEIVEVYPDGKIDIRTKGLDVFRILEIVKSIPEKQYCGAIVNYPDNNTKSSKLLIEKVLTGIHSLHKLLNVTKDFKKEVDTLTSYDLAHHAGLSLEEEYELLGLMHEHKDDDSFEKPARILPHVEFSTKNPILVYDLFQELEMVDIVPRIQSPY